MKKLFFYALLINMVFLLPCQAQIPFFNDPFFTNPFYSNPKRQPEFVGGEKALITYLEQNCKYPRKAKKASVQGIVQAEFIINEDGSITNPKILSGLGYGCDEEALRLISKMPKWKPATYNKKPVKVRYELPVVFKFQETDPVFKGGKKALDAFLQKTMTYPTEAVLDKIEGKVLVEFTVTNKGKVKNPTISKSLHKLLDEEALRVMQQMPDWIPATQDSKAIEKRVVMPIEFKLPKKKMQVI